jgi:hypothetical protein
MEYKNQSNDDISVEYILSFRNHPDLMKLDANTIELINKLCPTNHKKYKTNDTNNMILKNPKLQNKKDNIDNKVNLILNKLSESNHDNLLMEFINNIGQVSIEEYNLIQKTFYTKIMSEINFVKIYLKFFNSINYIYAKVQNYNMNYFIQLVEIKFYNDYTKTDLSEANMFLGELNTESYRTNNLAIIKTMHQMGLFSNDLIELCKNTLFEQKKYIQDIYHWFQWYTVDDMDMTIIKKILIDTGIDTRDRVLLESLIQTPCKKEEHVIDMKLIDTPKDVLLLEISNILEEYLLIESIDDITYFIDKKCTDALAKNKFCYNLIKKYSNNEDKLLELLKTLYNMEIISKNNINNGITLYKKQVNFNENKIKNIKNIL